MTIKSEVEKLMPTDEQVIEALVLALRPASGERWISELVADALLDHEWVGEAVLAAVGVDDRIVHAPDRSGSGPGDRHCPACGRAEQTGESCHVCGTLTRPGACAGRLMPLSEVSPYWRPVIAAVRSLKGWSEDGAPQAVPF